MKTSRKSVFALIGAMAMTAAVAAPSVEIVSVQQQYPWTNTVDILYNVAGVSSDTNGYFVAFTPTTQEGTPILDVNGESAIQVALSCSTNGAVAQWFPQTNQQYTACKMTPAVYRGGSGGGKDYMIVDLEKWTVFYEPMATQEASNERYNTQEYKTKKIALRRISSGKYTIGHSGVSNNKPHEVEVREGTCYYFSIFPVTEAQYARIMGTSTTSTSALPMHQPSWGTVRGNALPTATLSPNAKNTTSVLIRLSGLTGLDFDLPTEEMWEIAARAGATTKHWWGDTYNTNSPFWYSSNSGGKMHSVGEKAPNNWGIYDAFGNCWQMCRDVYVSTDLVQKTTDIYTPWTGSGTVRMSRGCHYDDTSTWIDPGLSGRSNNYTTANATGDRRCIRLAVVFK